MSDFTVHYDHIFLVAVLGERTAKKNVTKRGPGMQKPATLRFSGNFPGPAGDFYSAMVLSEDTYAGWYEGREMLPGYETATEAAATMVRRSPDICYGCPLCATRSQDAEIMTKHIREHVNTFIKQFRIEVEYACPLCAMCSPDVEVMTKHIQEHVNTLKKQLRAAIEEKDNAERITRESSGDECRTESETSDTPTVVGGPDSESGSI